MRCVQCFIIFVLLLLAPLCAYLQFGRSPAVPPVELSSLLLDGGDFPSDRWVAREPHPDDYYIAASDAWVRGFEVIPFGTEGGAVHTVIWYRSTDLAEKRYEKRRQAFFPTTGARAADLITSWQTPEALHYSSATADEFQLACARIKCSFCLEGELTSCGVLARYGSFISQFSVQMVPKYMTYDQLETMLRTIDERMAPYAEEQKAN